MAGSMTDTVNKRGGEPGNPAVRKKELRKRILAMRDALTEAERSSSEEKVTDAVLHLPEFLASDSVLGFASYGSEIGTEKILLASLKTGKKVYLPKIVSLGGVETMEFYRVRSLEELKPGYRGILEPSLEALNEEEPFLCTEASACRALLIMPGVVFDRHGHRIGYGKGFYDRFLSEKFPFWDRTVAIGFPCQLLSEIPHEAHDKPVSRIICL